MDQYFKCTNADDYTGEEPSPCRVCAKQWSRAQDIRALASGEKTAEQLQEDNCLGAHIKGASIVWYKLK